MDTGLAGYGIIVESRSSTWGRTPLRRDNRVTVADVASDHPEDFGGEARWCGKDSPPLLTGSRVGDESR